MARSKMKKIRDVPAEAIRAALYIRVSTDRQAEEGYSIEVQTERLEAYTKTFDGDVQYELYIDDGFSGASLERPAMQRLIADAENGVVTHILVLKLDRLSRSQKDTLHLIEDVFLPHNVAFVSVQESFNTATAFGRAVVGILSVFAQLERENIYERTRSGMQKRVEAGYWPGGGGVPFGYDYDPEKGIPDPRREFELVFSSKETDAPTIIYVPNAQYPDGFHVWLSDGWVAWDQADQVMYYYPTNDLPEAEHKVIIRPPFEEWTTEGWKYFVKGGQVISR